MVVPVNPMNLTDELRHYVTDSDATVIRLRGRSSSPRCGPLLGAGPRACRRGRLFRLLTAHGLEGAGCGEGAASGHLREPGVTLWTDALAANLAPARIVPGRTTCA